MGWTKEKPTIPGWYWWRPAPGHWPIIERYDMSADGLVSYGKNMDKFPIPPGEFSGPLTPPEEAT